jgi:hypothetical protein
LTAHDVLTEDLFNIYATAGREVTYITDRGEKRPYWANRYRQALQRSVEADEVIEFVERLVTQKEPSRGFGYLKDAGRLNLSAEALVVDESKPYHSMFSQDAVEAALERLAEHGFTLSATEDAASTPPPAPPTIAAGQFQPGWTFDLRVTVGPDGVLSLALI